MQVIIKNEASCNHKPIVNYQNISKQKVYSALITSFRIQKHHNRPITSDFYSKQNTSSFETPCKVHKNLEATKYS